MKQTGIDEMKKPELLSPAGSMESLKAAIEAGADAVYLGGKSFGARVFSNNFTNDELIEAFTYAHKYGVKVYVTANTLINESSVDEFMEYITFLYKNNADAVIIQDIGMMDLIRKTYPLFPVHASTQMHIHNLDGVKLVESLGLERVVLARETSIEKLAFIKENSNIELEVFIHGALCISYSGECLMSSLIGGRSGNKGSCAGCCRQKYNLISNGEKVNTDEYLLSTKDLSTVEYIGELIDLGITSFKIEGRMKSPEYVYMVTSLYREAIDSYMDSKKVHVNTEKFKKLTKLFNREFTKGFLFNEENDKITSSLRPNHLGIEIGKVISNEAGVIGIQLFDSLHLQDGIRILDKEDFGFTVTTMFYNHKKVDMAYKNDVVYIPSNISPTLLSKVVKTTDYLLNKEINESLKNLTRKVPINGSIEAFIGSPLKLTIEGITVTGSVVEQAKNQPITKERVLEQVSKLGDTIYKFNNLDIAMDESIFISIKEINELRRSAITKLEEKSLKGIPFKKETYTVTLPDFEKTKNYTCLISKPSEYNLLEYLPFSKLYFESEAFFDINDERKVLKTDIVMDSYKEKDNILTSELGGIGNNFTDYSLNVTNSYSVAFLHSHNVSLVTLSLELTYEEIKELIISYEKRYKKHPNLEVIVYGRFLAMTSKFNLNKLYNVTDTHLQDRFKNMYPIVIKNDLMHIYNYEVKDLTNNSYFDLGINSIRFQVFDEKDTTFIKKNLF
ncbi:MAG: U32 family peptidase [Bacilli bacterium]